MSKKIFIIFVLLFTQCKKTFEPASQDLKQKYFNTLNLDEALAEAEDISDLYSIIIGSHNELIIENYYNGFEPDSVHDVRSVTKSITSILIGIAIDKGYLANVDQKMADYLLPIIGSIDQDKNAITIEHLLTMSGGFEWVEFGDWSEYNNWRRADDQISYILDKPVIHTPGQIFNYNDAASHLLSVIGSEASGMDLVDFAQQYLFDPLNISPKPWIRDNRGYPFGCVALYLTPMDMYKIGMMYLHKGVYNGYRVISEQWINNSTEAKISTGNVIPYASNYGYLWWIDDIDGINYYMAMGYGGQFIVAVPGKKLVIVATCKWNIPGHQADQNWYDTATLIIKKIIPSTK